MMKAIATTAVATATVASSISYAHQSVSTERPPVFESNLKYVKPEQAYRQPRPAGQSPVYDPVAPQAAEDIDEMISRPKTGAEFARNLRNIFDQDLLLQDEFYSAVRLKDIFNLDEVSVTNSSDDDKVQVSIMASVSDSVFSRIKTSEAFGDSTANASFVGGRTTQRSGLTTAAINFGMYEGGPDFDVTQKIFAKKFVYLLPEPSPHGSLPPASAPHGNQTWRYQQVDDQTEKTITIGFNPTGGLDSVLIKIKKIK